MALLNRLNTDRSLSAFSGQFVPLKLITDGNPEWSSWARQYPYEGSAIPILFVVRADGEKLYAQSGSLEGADLPKMLLASLQQSGRTFNDAETLLLEASVTQAKAALEAEDQAAAARSLSQLAKLGAVGDLKSFSTIAVEADTLAKQLAESGQKSIDEAKDQLDDPQTALAGVLTLVEAESAYAGFTDLKLKVAAELRDLKKNSELKDPLRQAEALQRARLYAQSDNATVRKKAGDAYEQVITRFPGSAAETIARAELAAFDPDAAVLKTAAGESTGAAETVRTWTDATGKFKIDAKFVKQKEGFVQLQKANGDLVSLPISKLSAADQEYLKER